VAAKDAKHLFGPYVREIPRLPVGANKGTNKITTVAPPGTDGAGWLYNATTGDIKANCADSDVDSKGIPYNTY
jgi:hypothetical protein